jgi:hypothetical protein
MAKVKIQGHASGTGILTVTAPNTSTDRTITLPDATATIATTTEVALKAPIASPEFTGNVGIGMTPTQKLEVNGGIALPTTQLLRWNNSGTIAGAIGVDNSNNMILYNTEYNTERMRILSSGGITFNGDTAAANALDDYEEGTHNQVWTTGNSGSITMNRVAVSYIKIGRLVTIFGEVDVSTVSSPVGGCRVSLPFTIASHSAGRNATTMTRPGIYHVIHHQDNPPLFMIPAGSSVIEGVYEQDGGAFADYNPAAGDAIYFGFSYLTT